MDKILDLLGNHGPTILAWFGAIVAAATPIVALTKGDTDNKVLAVLVKILNFLSTKNPGEWRK